ncbi:MAG TPA: YceI family protein [Acidimicrobiales bacterium]|nr:YceI family protein [Acidimicrobiales bacterium]
MAENVIEIPGYIPGKWELDPVHTDISFTVRHMMVSKVRGHFTDFDGTIVTADNPLESSVQVNVRLNSINTANEDRDNHLRSADFFEIEKFPTMSFTSTGVRAVGSDFELDGELSLHGVTKPIVLKLEVNGFSKDPYGGTRSGFSASGEISRKDFDIVFNMPIDGGGVVVGEKVSIHLEVEAILQG